MFKIIVAAILLEKVKNITMSMVVILNSGCALMKNIILFFHKSQWNCARITASITACVHMPVAAILVQKSHCNIKSEISEYWITHVVYNHKQLWTVSNYYYEKKTKVLLTTKHFYPGLTLNNCRLVYFVNLICKDWQIFLTLFTPP